MRPTIGVTVTLVPLLWGCMGREDLVARSALVEEQPDASSDGGAAGGLPPGCSESTRSVVVITKRGRIMRVRPDTAEVEDLGIPNCLEEGAYVHAVDRSGAIWVWLSSQSGMKVVDPVSLTCDQIDLKLEVAAMAFVYDPSARSERLYVFGISENHRFMQLTAIDPRTLERTIVGEVVTPQPDPDQYTAHTRAITGTHDGRLFALSDGPLGRVAIARVDLETAKLTNVWPEAGLDNLTFGGAAWSSDFILMASALPPALTRFKTKSEQTSFVLFLDHDDEGWFGVSSSSCATAL